jgi:hypothetical protein
VVHGEPQQVPLGRDPHEAEPDRGRRREVEGRAGTGLGERAGRGLALVRGPVGDVGAGERDRRRRMDQGLRLAVFGRRERGAQGFVAGHEPVEAALERRLVQRAVEAERAAEVVGVALRLELPEEPQATLAEREPVRRVVGERHDRQALEGDPAGVERVEEGGALLRRQGGEAAGEPVPARVAVGGGRHGQTSSHSASRASTSSRARASSPPSICAASAASVGAA